MPTEHPDVPNITLSGSHDTSLDLHAASRDPNDTPPSSHNQIGWAHRTHVRRVRMTRRFANAAHLRAIYHTSWRMKTSPSSWATQMGHYSTADGRVRHMADSPTNSLRSRNTRPGSCNNSSGPHKTHMASLPTSIAGHATPRGAHATTRKARGNRRGAPTPKRRRAHATPGWPHITHTRVMTPHRWARVAHRSTRTTRTWHCITPRPVHIARPAFASDTGGPMLHFARLASHAAGLAQQHTGSCDTPCGSRSATLCGAQQWWAILTHHCARTLFRLARVTHRQLRETQRGAYTTHIGVATYHATRLPA